MGEVRSPELHFHAEWVGKSLEDTEWKVDVIGLGF